MDLIVTLQCKDQPGIVHAMTTAVLSAKGNIIENQQFTDPLTSDFVMRTRFETKLELGEVKRILNSGLDHFKPKLQIRSLDQQKRVLILVTKESHCLRDLLYLQELGELPIEIAAVVSNHQDLKALVESHNIKFIDQSTLDKKPAETQISNLVDELQIDLIVLARYMQILTKELCEQMFGQIINIHHSFLPGFKGAKPYHQAHSRGVKIIGATAHFVTPDLDEGPIIDQDVAHVTHAATPEDLIATGRDIERRVLSRAVRDFAQDRIFIVGDKTVVFHN
ncbi:MAG: formyltetrahydrofolate deformylase [Actinomycetota bacterium]|jgi:formyltetrahydrofolate deformylase|tara:strand:+ start:3111 stop:3947 length:837 start_codon:yes stop_codon:yes gene_type:complete